MAELQLIVVTPEATAIDQSTRFVALPLFDGELGIAPDHAPLIGRLGCGELRYDGNGTTHRYYIDGGFVQVADNVVSVMTGQAIPSAELRTEQEQAALETALHQPAHSPEAIASRDIKVDQARARLRLSTK